MTELSDPVPGWQADKSVIKSFFHYLILAKATVYKTFS